MNRVSRALVALTVAGVAVPLWAAPASAATAAEAASSAAWFSQTGLTQPPGLEAAPAPPPITNEVDGVAPGNLAVAAQGSNEDKVTFLFFGLSEVPAGATVTKATLTVPEVPADNANVSFGVDDPAVVSACKIIGSGFSSEEGTALGLAPERDCAGFAAPATREGTALVFDLTALVTSWAEVNDGVALTRTPDGTSPFQVVLANEASLAVDFTAPAEEATADPSTGSGSVTSDLGGGFSGGTTDLSTSSGSSSLGGFSGGSGGGFGSVDAPLLPDVNAPLPSTAEEAAAGPVVAAPVSSPRVLSGSSSPTAGFWLAALLLAGGLALLSLIVGDPRAVSAGGAAPSRLAQALAARRSGGLGPLQAGPPSA